MRHYRHFRQLPSVQQQRKGILSGILFHDFLHFDGVIREEIVEDKEIDLSFQSLIIPKNPEREHLAIIIQILLQAGIGVSPSEFNFEVLLVFLGVRWRNLHVFQRLVELVVVQGHWFAGVQRDVHIQVEPLCEFIAIRYPEMPFEEIHIYCEIQILKKKKIKLFKIIKIILKLSPPPPPPNLPTIELLDSQFSGNALPFNENSLRDLRIFHWRLSHVERVIR